MTPTHLLELSRNGDPKAIATYFNQALRGKNATVSTDWQGGQLNIRFESTTLPTQPRLLAFVRRSLKTLRVEAVESVRVYAYEPKNPLPLWTHLLELKSNGKERGEPTVLATDSVEPDPLDLLTSAPPLAEPLIDRFLVCGLGGLGQYCVYSLKRFALREFEIRVTAIEKVQPQEWEVQDLPSLLDEPVMIGDCRDEQMLLKAGIESCRAILLVTSDESVNIETAIVARRLNPKIRLIVRSSRQSLNQLLKQQWGDFVAFEPTELPANAFTLAGLGAGILGFFDIGDRRLQVVEQRVAPKDLRFDGCEANSLLHKSKYRLLSYAQASDTQLSNRAFYQWRSGTQIKAGDTVTYIEIVEQSKPLTEVVVRENGWRSFWQKVRGTGSIQARLTQLWGWMQATRTRLIVEGVVALAIVLWSVGTVILKLNVRSSGSPNGAMVEMSWEKAMSSAVILLLGGYGDLFGSLQEDHVPGWVQVICLLITVISLLVVLGAFGFITDLFISSRFSFFRKRPPIPKRNHVVIVGFGRVGQRIAALLKDFKQPFVAIAEQLDDPMLQTRMPLLVGDPLTELAKTNLADAKSVIVVTEDQMLNLEVALLARNAAQQINRDIGLVVRTYDQRFSDNLGSLLPDAKAMAAYALSSEAFASAAFGENILGLFQLNQQTILVTDYRITDKDSLVHKTLAQVAYGYGVVPIYHQPTVTVFDADKAFLPSDDRPLQAGDRLVILSSINGLRRIEHDDMNVPPRWKLTITRPLTSDDAHDFSNLLFRLSGCDLEQARLFMANLPGELELALYPYQAHRLEQELGKRVTLRLEAIN